MLMYKVVRKQIVSQEPTVALELLHDMGLTPVFSHVCSWTKDAAIPRSFAASNPLAVLQLIRRPQTTCVAVQPAAWSLTNKRGCRTDPLTYTDTIS